MWLCPGSTATTGILPIFEYCLSARARPTWDFLERPSVAGCKPKLLVADTEVLRDCADVSSEGVLALHKGSLEGRSRGFGQVRPQQFPCQLALEFRVVGGAPAEANETRAFVFGWEQKLGCATFPGAFHLPQAFPSIHTRPSL